MIRLSGREFEQLVEQALGELPERFAALLDNVAIVVEEEPSADDLDLLEEGANELLGIYRGVPITERSYDSMRLPDQIAIFRGPILRISATKRDAHRQIRDTVIHELGHYFGLNDHQMLY